MNPQAIIFLCVVLLILTVWTLLYRRDLKLLKTVTKPHRGTPSERRMVLKLLRYKIPAQTIFHDLYLRKSNGKYAQIDLVVATKVGIIVFEIKEYSGWIFGTGNQTEWTQVLAYGNRKYRFYNPIFQNRTHISELINQLPQLKTIPIYSVIVFFGNCEFRDLKLIPDNVFLIKSSQLYKILKKIMHTNQPAKYTDKKEIVNLLNSGVQNGEDSEIRKEHIRHIQTRRGKYNDY